MYYAKIIDRIIEGFYIEEFHGEELCQSIVESGGIEVDEELHQYIISLGKAEFLGIKEEKIYTIIDKDLFKEVIQPEDTTPHPPSDVDLLKEEVLQQAESMVDMDFRLTSLELGL